MAFYLQVMFITSSLAIFLFAGDGRFAGSDNRSLEFLLRAWSWPSSFDLAFMVVVGVLNAFGGYLISQGYRLAEVSVVAPFEYVAIPLAVIWGFLIWSDFPDAISWIGICMILGAGLFVACCMEGNPPGYSDESMTHFALGNSPNSMMSGNTKASSFSQSATSSGFKTA